MKFKELDSDSKGDISTASDSIKVLPFGIRTMK